MFTPTLSPNEEALVACFENESKAVGFDGKHDLQPNERGALAVADLARAQTLLRIFTVLGLGGRAAAEAAFNIASVAVPASLEEVEQTLRHLYEIR